MIYIFILLIICFHFVKFKVIYILCCEIQCFGPPRFDKIHCWKYFVLMESKLHYSRCFLFELFRENARPWERWPIKGHHRMSIIWSHITLKSEKIYYLYFIRILYLLSIHSKSIGTVCEPIKHLSSIHIWIRVGVISCISRRIGTIDTTTFKSDIHKRIC